MDLIKNSIMAVKNYVDMPGHLWLPRNYYVRKIALLTELHPSDFPLLRNNFKEFKNITTKSENGFQQLKATSPKERRGLVLIDPPYELKEDYDLVVKAIEEGYKRFATGTYYAIWYPVVLRQQTKRIFKVD